MIKRAIILVLILGGLYWLMNTMRDNSAENIVSPSRKTVEKTEKKDHKSKTDKKEEKKVEKKEDKVSDQKESVDNSKEVKDILQEEDKAKDLNTKKEEKEQKTIRAKSDKKEIDKSVESKKPVIEEVKDTTPVVVIEDKSSSSQVSKQKTETKPKSTVNRRVSKPKPKITYPNRTTQVKVYLYEWAIDVSKKEIPSGTIVFEVINDGKFSHTFNIRGVKNFGKVPPHASANFTAPFLPGEFEIYSDKRDDYENGMSEKITVVK